jgi:hypothetical protein
MAGETRSTALDVICAGCQPSRVGVLVALLQQCRMLPSAYTTSVCLSSMMRVVCACVSSMLYMYTYHHAGNLVSEENGELSTFKSNTHTSNMCSTSNAERQQSIWPREPSTSSCQSHRKNVLH